MTAAVTEASKSACDLTAKPPLVQVLRLSLLVQVLRLSLLLCLLLLQACQSSVSVRETATTLTPELQTQTAAARASLNDGDPTRAAEQYAQLAQTDPVRRARWQLLQADALYLAGQYQRSNSLLQLLDVAALSIAELALLDLLQTENAIALLDAGNLPQLAADLSFSQTQLAQQYQPRAQAALELLRLDFSGTVELDSAHLASAQLAWAILQQAWPDALLRETAFAALAETDFMTLAQLHADTDSDDTARGWLAAAAQARQQAIEQHFELHWQQPTAASLTALLAAPSNEEQQAFADLYVAAASFPRRIAVILPQAGNLQSAADAIRMGIMSAWSMLTEASRPELHFIAADQGMTGAYYEALELRSELILGPLSAENVRAMRDLPDRTMPMLALNLPTELPADVPAADYENASSATTEPSDNNAKTRPLQSLASSYYFALPPEDSAAAAARWMRQLGHRNVVALASDDVIGQRQLQAFISALQEDHGTLVRQTLFDPAAVEFTDLLNTVLGLQNSLQRQQQLQQLLGLELGFRARADANIDALFVAADQRQSRLLLPQLKFVDADYLPVFVTARSYAAERNSSADRDLNGAYLPLPGWLLGAPPSPLLTQLQQWYPAARNDVVARLFGLGRDSLLLSAHTRQVQGDESLRLQAASGDLYIDRAGLVRRELQHARYRNGVITLQQ